MNKSIQKPSAGNSAKKPSAFIRRTPKRALAIIGTSGLVFGVGFAGSIPAYSNGVPNCAGREVIAAGKSPSERVSAIELMAATPGVVCLNGVFVLDGVVTVREDVTFYGVGNSSSIENPLGTVFDAINPGLLTIDNLTISGSQNAISGYNISITNSTFSNNTSQVGTISAVGTVTVSNSSFASNSTIAGVEDATGHGGVITAMGPVTVSNSTFSNNTAPITGGAIFSEQTVTVSNSTFSNNTAGAGGAIYAGQATVSGSLFSGNLAEVGGAIVTSSVVVSESTFSNNTGASGGGAIVGYSVVVSESTFSNNTAGDGGAIFSLFVEPFESDPGFEGSVVATNSTFVNNSAVNEGGAIFATEGNVYFSTFVNNVASTPLSLETADIPGNAIYKSGTETLTLAGNIFAGNNNSFPQLGTGAPVSDTPFTGAGGNIFSTSAEPDISGTDAPVFGATLPSLFGTNSPTLATYAPNTNGTQTIALAPGSPALNAVPNLAPYNLITLDQRGATRTFPADAGAFEVVVAPISTPTSTTPTVLAKTGNENILWSSLASGSLIVFGTWVAMVTSRIRRRTSNL